MDLTIGTIEDNFKLVYCREEEIVKILECLSEHPFVFVYASAGNGKTAFGVEFRERVPGAVLILGSQLELEDINAIGLYNENFDQARIIIVDELDARLDKIRDNIENLLSKGKKFIFMVHYPKNRYIKWREQNQEYLEPIVCLVNDYPDTPWLHLTKYNENH